MFAARGKVGPFRASADAHLGAEGRVGARMTLHDEGNEDRVLTSASALAARRPLTPTGPAARRRRM